MTSSAAAPGRVTILGEHTDYNDGVSLAVATSQRTSVEVTPDRSGHVRVDSDALGTAAMALGATGGPSFARLAAAIVADAGFLGARVVVRSEVPVGAGVSSSAAYAVALCLAVGLTGDAVALARRCQAAERDAGSDVGLLDQLVSLAAEPGRALHLDFHDLELTTVVVDEAIGLSVVDTGVTRAVGDTPYARRREECALAAARIGPLGLAAPDDVARIADPVLRRRARHVVTECARVEAARDALEHRDLAVLGRLLDEGHASLRDDFEASAPGVEAARDALLAQPGVRGVRLTGAGFGGAVVVAHDPAVRPGLEGRWSAHLTGGAGALSLRR